MNHSSVFPPVSPGRAREVDAAGGVCWVASKDDPGGGARTPSIPRGLALDPIEPERTTTMVDETPTPSHKIRVHKDDGRWQVTFPCDCPDLNFRRYDVALTFATHHHCPPPWMPIPAWRKRLTRTVR